MIAGECWRIRMRCNNHEVTKEAWEKGVVGIWYGAATAEEITRALNLNSREGQDFLMSLPNQLKLNWTGIDLNIPRRFSQIAEDDWIFTYYGDSLHFAHVSSAMRSDSDHEWNFDGETFKYRSIVQKKSFPLRDLPDGFRLLTMSGRSNVHRVPGTEKLVRILADSTDTENAKRKIREMSLTKWLDVLGPSSWESLCLAYLIREIGFVPAGLDVGRTLPMFDVVGRDKVGNKVFAQCKKDPSPRDVETAFGEASKNASTEIRYYHFAYAGCGEIEPPSGITLVTGAQMNMWLKAREQQQYVGWLRS